MVDETGSRRFWVVPVQQIDLEALSKLNVPQLWRQVQHDVLIKGHQCFRLTPLERQQLEQRNSQYQMPLKAESEVRDILTDANTDSAHYCWEDMTVTDFKLCYDSLRNYSVNTISKALDRVGYTSQRKKIDGKVSRLRNLPRYCYKSNMKTG